MFENPTQDEIYTALRAARVRYGFSEVTIGGWVADLRRVVALPAEHPTVLIASQGRVFASRDVWLHEDQNVSRLDMRAYVTAANLHELPTAALQAKARELLGLAAVEEEEEASNG